MIRPVAAGAEPESESKTTLADVGREALGADALLFCDPSSLGRPGLLGSSGLSAAEEDAVLAALSLRSPDGTLETAGWAQALTYDSVEPGLGPVRLCALQRRRRAFERSRLATVIARHAAVAADVRRQYRHPVTGPPEINAYELSEQAHDWAALDRAVTQQVRRLVPVERTGVLMWDEEQQALAPVPGAFGLDPGRALPVHARTNWQSSAPRVFATGEPYITNHPVDYSGARPDYRSAFVIQRLIAVPIEAAGRRVGVFQAVNKEAPFTVADAQRLTAVAPVLACAVEMAYLREGLRRGRRLEELFTSTAVAVATGGVIGDDMVARLGDLRAALDGSVVALVPRNGEPIICREGESGAPAERALLAQASEAKGFAAFDAPPRRPGDAGWSSAHVPILLDGAIVATLSFLRSGRARLGPGEHEALSRMAQLIAVGLATEDYQRHLADAGRRAERQRIADQLHDQVAQLLFAARLSLDQGEASIPEPAAQGVRRARELLVRADEVTRAIMDDNRGEAMTHVTDLLALVISEIEDEYGRAVGLDVDPRAAQAADGLTDAARRLLARSAREALVNAAKHAGPCRISVRLALTHRGRLLLTVTDAGLGVTSRRQDGYGTSALRRAVSRQGGTLRVSAISAAGGTRVAVSLPT